MIEIRLRAVRTVYVSWIKVYSFGDLCIFFFSRDH